MLNPFVGRLSVLSICLIAAASSWAESPEPEKRVIVSGKKQGTMRPGALRDELIKTESLDEKAIARAGATNINEALDKNPGIAVQVECSICNVRIVLLNNLPGRYTTVMQDGVPIYSSVSSAYGLDSLSVYGVERIDVARGAGASLIAPEALAGTVNIVTKRPNSAENRARMHVGSFASRQTDVYVARPFASLGGGAISATLNYNRHDAVDADGNGVSEFTGFERKLGGFSFFLDDVGGFKIKGRFDLVDEKRNGGAMGRDYAAIKANISGNPFDWRRGQHGSSSQHGWIKPVDGSFVPYDGGAGGFSEIIFTDRKQFVATAEKRLGENKLRLALGTAQHEQDSFYEGVTYLAKQKQHYLEAAWIMPIYAWTLTTGLNYRYEDLRSSGTINLGIDNYLYRSPAVFVQAYRSLFDEALEINASLRHDQHNVFGGISSPRFNALYHHTDHLSSRISLGRGFRAPTSFFEQDHGILSTARIVRLINQPELSNNASYALSYAGDRLALTASYNYNRIQNFSLLDSGQIDENAVPVTHFSSAKRPVTVQGVDLNLSYMLTPALTVSPALEFFKYDFAPGTLVFARPQTKAYLRLDYEQGDWDFSSKLVWTGRMDLAKFHDDGSGQQNRYNFDGSPKREQSPSFLSLDMRAEYHLNKRISLYAGVDNLFDYKQSDKESTLFVYADGAPDYTHLWGPNRGRALYAGVKLSY